MKEILQNKKVFIFAVALLLAICAGAVVYYGGYNKVRTAVFSGERIITETPTVHIMDSTSALDGKYAGSTGEPIELVSREHVVIAGGTTPKEAYLFAENIAKTWSEDVKLVYIKSLGTVTVDGTSSGWVVVFGSKEMNQGYSVYITNGAVVEKGTVDIQSYGYELPSDWYDGVEAIRSIQNLPQFSKSTISGLSFAYNEDGKRWGYVITSSNGTVSVPVR